MDILKNEKGLTLIEVLLSITILSVIFISFINFFPQMGLMNKQNEVKTQAVNSAKEVLNSWKSDPKVIKALKENNPLEFPSGLTSSSGDYYTFNTLNPNTEIRIWKNIENGFSLSDSIKVYKIQVLMKNNRNLPISETYGYVLVK